MMRSSIVTRIIIKTQRPSMLVAAIVGCLVGFFLVIASIQVYYNFNHILSDKDQAIGSQFLVLNKNVSVINTMDNKKSVFSSQEIDALKSQPFVERISPFLPNQFSAMAWLQFSVGDGNNVELKTDLFMESVDDGFIDVKSEDWKWDLGNDVIPVILPTDFINLYNFTYAPARGLPQLSKSTVSLFSFKIILGEGTSQKILKGKIIGFSNRINSMVVP
ncbi:MAG: hypothetical protein FGM46_05665, partial [Ferruginibacter sp.]|nr:hypothetical protein [Ferruginibacter sp.]